MKESLTKKTAAVALGLSVALGTNACGNPFSDKDPNELSACPDGWTAPVFINQEQSQAHAAMQRATGELVAQLQEAAGTSESGIRVARVPASLKNAADILIGKTNQYWYDTSDLKLAGQGAEFCTDDTFTTWVYPTPAFVQAEAALEAADIPVHQYRDFHHRD